MAAKVPWFERRFNFDFPVGCYPDLIDRLRGTPARLEEKLRVLSPDVLTRRERATTWSVRRTPDICWILKRSTTGGSRGFPENGLARRRSHRHATVCGPEQSQDS